MIKKILSNGGFQLIMSFLFVVLMLTTKDMGNKIDDGVLAIVIYLDYFKGRILKD